MKSLQQILYCLATIVVFFVSQNCKSRNSKWREALSAQMGQQKNLRPLDSSIYGFMLTYHVPAMSVTIGKDSSIIYSRTYGLANLSKKEPADTESMFRIAGLSTAITSLAISKLIQEGKIAYSSKVFGKDGILGPGYGPKTMPIFVSEITIGDLLRMESGCWSGADDYMIDRDLRGTFVRKDSAISWILDHTELKQKPGTMINFSYTGFFILGSVIEKVTGEPYDTWVRENILIPSGITRMQIEKEGFKIPREVTYYKDLSWPLYNGEIDEDLYLTKADAAMGWVATSSDLVSLMQKFKQINHFSKDETSPHVKSANSNEDYFPDWTYVADRSNWWLQFIYYGSTSVLVKSSKGFYWSILINTYRPAENEFFTDLDSLIRNSMSHPESITGRDSKL